MADATVADLTCTKGDESNCAEGSCCLETAVGDLKTYVCSPTEGVAALQEAADAVDGNETTFTCAGAVATGVAALFTAATSAAMLM